MTDNGLAALAAALPNVPTVKALTIRLGRFNGAWWDRFASEILAALDGWTLVRDAGNPCYRRGDPMNDPALVEAIRQIALLNAEIATLRAALDGLVEAAEETVRSAILVEIGPDTEVWSVHSTSLASLRAALAAVKEAGG